MKIKLTQIGVSTEFWKHDACTLKFFFRLLLVTIVFFQHSNSNGQYHRKIHLSQESNSLSKKSSVSDTAFIQVLFALKDSFSIGNFSLSGINETEQVSADQPLERWANTYVATKTSPDVKDRILYKWVLRTLSSSSDTSFNVLYTHVAADIFRSDATGGKFALSATVDTVLSRPYVDSSAFLDALYASMDALYELSKPGFSVQQGNTRKNASNVFDIQSSKAYSSISIDSLSDKIRSYSSKVIEDSVCVKGIYMTYAEFLKNAPSVTGPIWLRADTLAGNGHARLFRMGTDSTVEEIHNAWGVCFGGAETYKLESGQPLAIERQGKEFVLSRYVDYRSRRNQGLVWRMAMGSAWPNDNNPYERKRSFPLINYRGLQFKAGNAPTATKLEMSSGDLSF